MKRTIFEGTVNGEKFDNVQAYNARVSELIQSGELVSASTSTRVEDYEHSGYCRTCDDTPSVEGTLTTTADNLPWECDCTECVDPWEDDELSFYPYLDEDDPFYLDLLVTSHRETNREALNEVRRIFEKCKRYIIDAIEDKDTDLETKKNYLEDIKEIIENLADDKKDTLEAIKKVEKKAENLRKEYEERLQAIDRDRFLLEESRPVIDEFLDFYRSVESDVILNIKDSTEKSKCTCGDKCTCEKEKDINNNNIKYKVVIPSNQVSAECKQVHPQIETDLNSILQRIFGPFRGIK